MKNIEKINNSLYFSSPLYIIEIPQWINNVNKICDKYLKESKKNNTKIIKEREKKLNKKIS